MLHSIELVKARSNRFKKFSDGWHIDPEPMGSSLKQEEKPPPSQSMGLTNACPTQAVGEDVESLTPLDGKRDNLSRSQTKGS
jgi:hypothetical protein